MSVNKVILLGNLGSNPELKSFPNGNTIATVNLATTFAYAYHLWF